jgi:UDP:flavonoid glycosyltransferase YjiC (YdhE family)
MEASSEAPGSFYFDGGSSGLKVYVSFGTVVWRYWAAEALEGMMRISRSLAAMSDVSAVISLGGAQLEPDAVGAIARPGVSVAGYVDQWRILREADVFVTHNGVRSTHEAIVHGVPMISCPFFWDQPALAERCRQFGLSVPLTGAPRSGIGDEDTGAALAELAANRDSMQASLADAREWELEVVANRESVVRRVMDLIPT